MTTQRFSKSANQPPIDERGCSRTTQQSQRSPNSLSTALHDGQSHHPLGGGSYAFKANLVPYLLRFCHPNKPIVVQIGAQPNNSPHLGTIVTFAVAFNLAKALKDRREGGGGVKIQVDLVDTAPSDSITIGGVRYQRSLRQTRAMDTFLADYEDILDQFSYATSIPFSLGKQRDFNSNPSIPRIVSDIVAKREKLGPMLAPETHKLALRAACQVEGCGLTDKHGILNDYSKAPEVTFSCPDHGHFSLDLRKIEDCGRLEYNAPLRNLIRARVHVEDEEKKYIRVTGGDYAGVYQEQFLWRPLCTLFSDRELDECDVPSIVYAPVIEDWSGGKLSKSLYIKDGAYAYLKDIDMEWVVSYEKMKERNFDVMGIFEEVKRWVDDPRMLFRNYSIYYFAKVMEEWEEDRRRRDDSGCYIPRVGSV